MAEIDKPLDQRIDLVQVAVEKVQEILGVTERSEQAYAGLRRAITHFGSSECAAPREAEVILTGFLDVDEFGEQRLTLDDGTSVLIDQTLKGVTVKDVG